MTDNRDRILGQVRAALKPLKQRAAYPTYDDAIAITRGFGERDLFTEFSERLNLVRGQVFTSAAAVTEWLREHDFTRGYCDPKLWPELSPSFANGFTVETEFVRERIDNYQFGITRAVGAIAGTGTIILNDAVTSNRLAALAPWVHLAVVHRNQIYAHIAEALARLGNDRNVIWCTGPSKTADIEGILVEGVHGPGEQFALVLD